MDNFLIENGVLVKYLGEEINVSIPDGVKKIGEDAFRDNKKIQSVFIPESVTSIDNYAFLGCSSLKTINIPNGVGRISYSVFYNCSSLESIVLPEGITIIEEAAFQNCTSLKSIIIPKNVNVIGDEAFLGCSALENVVITEGVKVISNDAFRECDSLKEIFIPKTIWAIENNPFYKCKSLTSIVVDKDNDHFSSMNGILYDKKQSDVICYPTGKKDATYVAPLSVEVICDYAFYENPYIKSVVLSDNIDIIGEDSFSRCSSLESISLGSGLYLIFDYAFEGSPLTNIVFNGTKEDWEEIDLREGWNENIPATEVHCVDGDIIFE